MFLNVVINIIYVYEKFKNSYFYALSGNINRVLHGSDSGLYSKDYLRISACQYYLKHKFKKTSCKY